jgi:hypothetical protein
MSKRYGTVVERFLRYSKYVEDPDWCAPCYEWIGPKDEFGYGRFRVDGRKMRAHRWLWEHANGPVPEGMIVRHTCDNPGCVRLMHLTIGTPADNVADKVERNRQCKGSASPSAKLREDDIARIRQDARTHRAIAADYGVAHNIIGRIKRGKLWKHV